MTGMDKYYQILGLNSGASEEEIKQAYRDLVNVWHPDRFPNNQRLREKANEKLKEINLAYENLKSYIAGNSRQTALRSQPYSDEPLRGFARHFTQKSPAHISCKLLALFFVVLGFRFGTNFNNEVVGAILGLLIGMGVGKFINHMDKTKECKIKVVWGAAIAGLLLFIILSALTTSQHARSTSSNPSSTLYERLTSNHSTLPLNSAPATEDGEAQKIGFLFESIRQANLQKDVELFMSCFSRGFSDAEAKRKDTLKLWDTFDYNDLSYKFKRQTISRNTADVRLEWLVTASEKLGGKPHNGTTVLDVTLKREDGCWKILEIKPVN